MWAVIVRSKRSEWIHWRTISRTRQGAMDHYKKEWNPEYQNRANDELKSNKIRLAKVVVSEEAA